MNTSYTCIVKNTPCSVFVKYNEENALVKKKVWHHGMVPLTHSVTPACTRRLAHDKIRANKKGVVPILLVSIHYVSRRGILASKTGSMPILLALI